MPHELSLRFPGDRQVLVGFDGEESGVLEFADPLTAKDRRDLQWYLEIYGAHSLGDPDDAEAVRIAARLPEMGAALFDAVFRHRAAQRLFHRLQEQEEGPRLLTVSSESPAVLGLPWELLHDPGQGVFLFGENPPISIRRRVPGATGGRAPFRIEPKDRLHLLFMVSRPTGTGLLDPRADPRAVLDALEAHAPGRVTWEFLRPPTLDALVERLKDRRRPAVDILHFDGHGLFDARGGMPKRYGEERRLGTAASELLRHGTVGIDAPADTGYLLFETAAGEVDFVSAEKLGANLHRHRVSLVILAACQSAMLAAGGGDDPGEGAMGGVASRLTATGIPAVLAMSHTILAETTRSLFGEMYEGLARGHGIGEALDNARQLLANHPERYEVQRGAGRAWLCLQDWFVPALYQSGPDVPLLRHIDAPAAGGTTGPRLSPGLVTPEAGFFGRRRELWEIERWFAGETRRITLTGFGGQGKTALAQEAGRWLARTGMFQAAAFVDYFRFRGLDAVANAMNEIGSVLGESFPDPEAARQALARTPMLLILDNVEALAPEPRRELLDTAALWSGTGACRVLLTTRQPDFEHPEYRLEGTDRHRRIALDGLGSRRSPDDALEWFARLWRLPPGPSLRKPSRQELVDLFAGVRFHPLSIRVLAQQLKTRPAWEVKRRLQELLAQERSGAGSEAGDEAPPELVASIRLSLDRLDPEAQAVLPRLGVFQGGAMEQNLLAVTGLGETGEREGQLAILEDALQDDESLGFWMQIAGVPREEQTEIRAQVQETVADLRQEIAHQPPQDPDANLWPALRRQLEAAALVEAEHVPPGFDAEFIRFHPTLAPLLWARTSPEERARLGLAHRERYRKMASHLFDLDRLMPRVARAVALLEMPNLLHAIHDGIAQGDPGIHEFAIDLGYLLTLFQWKQEQEEIVRRLQSLVGERGTSSWVGAQIQQIELLVREGRGAEAATLCSSMLESLGPDDTAVRACLLGNLGRCHLLDGRIRLAEQRLREALAEFESVQPLDPLMRTVQAELLAVLGGTLSTEGRYAEARQLTEEALSIALQLRNVREAALFKSQLGELALITGELEEAEKCYRETLTSFHEFQEPLMEALVMHQLGLVREMRGDGAEAELLLREAAQIKEREGLLRGPQGAIASWTQLGRVIQASGNPSGAEQWFRKAIQVARGTGDLLNQMTALHSLSYLLRQDPGRLAEARQVAEEELALAQALDPGVGEIWKSFDLLADIADQEGRLEQAAGYRRLAREALRAFPGTREAFQHSAPLVAILLAAINDPEEVPSAEQLLKELRGQGWESLAEAFRRVLDGERDEMALCESLRLNFRDSMILGLLLDALADPSVLADLLAERAAAQEEAGA